MHNFPKLQGVVPFRRSNCFKATGVSIKNVYYLL